jgi:L-rhamnose mutarotase
VIEAGPNFDPAAKAEADAADADVRAWEELMWRFQRALPWARSGEKWTEAEKIYALSEQP